VTEDGSNVLYVHRQKRIIKNCTTLKINCSGPVPNCSVLTLLVGRQEWHPTCTKISNPERFPGRPVMGLTSCVWKKIVS